MAATSLTCASSLTGTLGAESVGYSLTSTITLASNIKRDIVTSVGLTTSTPIFVGANHGVSAASPEFSYIEIIIDPDKELSSSDTVNIEIVYTQSGSTTTGTAAFFAVTRDSNVIRLGGSCAESGGSISSVNRYITRINAYVPSLSGGLTTVKCRVLGFK